MVQCIVDLAFLVSESYDPFRVYCRLQAVVEFALTFVVFTWIILLAVSLTSANFALANRETISLMYNLVRVSILSVSQFCNEVHRYSLPLPHRNLRYCTDWSDNIRPEGFLSPILMLAVITVAVAMVVLVVIDAIIGVVVDVSGVPSIYKLSFVIVWLLDRLLGICISTEGQASSVRVTSSKCPLCFSDTVCYEKLDSIRSNQGMRHLHPFRTMK
ncbi:hypothetical protein Tco_0368121 [Tanacetum coccineum]